MRQSVKTTTYRWEDRFSFHRPIHILIRHARHVEPRDIWLGLRRVIRREVRHGYWYVVSVCVFLILTVGVTWLSFWQ